MSDNWQPIETAPKDGTRILLWLRAPFSRAEIAEWYEPFGTWIDDPIDVDPDADVYGIGSAVPTHWQPVTPPKTEAPSSNGAGHGNGPETEGDTE